MTKELECTTESGNCMGEKEYWCKQLNKEEVMHVSRLKRWYVYSANKINNRLGAIDNWFTQPILL